VLEGPANEGDGRPDPPPATGRRKRLRRDTTYSIYYGGDHAGRGSRSTSFGDLVVVRSLSDSSLVPTTFVEADFSDAFHGVFPNTKVRIHSFCSLVYIFRKGFRDYSSEKKTPGQTFQLLSERS
jgi:hypothetical protein